MKTKFALISIAAGFLLIGCATPKILSPAIPAQPAQPAITNAATGIVTPALPAVAAVPAVITNLPNQTAMKIVSAGNEVAPFVPPPYGDILAGILGVVAAGAGLIARSKNKQLSDVTGVANTIIQGVQSAGTAAAAVKQSIAAMAASNGNADAVEKHVNKITGSI